MRGSALIVAAACATATGTAAASAAARDAATCAGGDRAPTAATASAARAAIACLIDAARAERGRPALHRDGRLDIAAQRFARALDPARPLTHTGRGGTSPLDRIAATGYGRATGFAAAEALGRGQGGYATPAIRVKTWLQDASTRQMLLSARYRDVGVGVVTRGTVTTYVVDLARRGTVSSSSSDSSR